jgi:hypothetical protein
MAFIGGDPYVYCDRTGAKVRLSQTRKEWSGKRVRIEEYEDRHPQDFVRSVVDRQTRAVLRSEPADQFVEGIPDIDESTLAGYDALPPELKS